MSYPSNRRRRWAERHKAQVQAQAQAGGHRDAVTASAVRGIAALASKNPAEIVAAIADGKIPYVTINFGGTPE